MSNTFYEQNTFDHRKYFVKNSESYRLQFEEINKTKTVRGIYTILLGFESCIVCCGKGIESKSLNFPKDYYEFIARLSESDIEKFTQLKPN